MAGGLQRKIFAASARSHTRRAKQHSSFNISSGAIKKLSLVLLVVVLAWLYRAIRPPPPKLCGHPNGPPVTAQRIRLDDGRYLAYKEHGVPKETSKYKIIFVHGTDSSMHDLAAVANFSSGTVQELGVCVISFDRPGYGQSDPHPERSPKSLASDIEQLADRLHLGPKFHVIGFSMGGALSWGCLRYIPHRLAGVGLLAPVVNYWWPSFPANLSALAYHRQLPSDQWALRVAHYAPWLTYWWNTQKWFPSSSVAARKPDVLSRQDKEILTTIASDTEKFWGYPRQQGEYESIHRDMMVAFGNWEFDPMTLNPPFPNNKSHVQIWQGDEDLLVPVILQRYIAQRLPWVYYHELSGSGHLFPYTPGMMDTVIRELIGDPHEL